MKRGYITLVLEEPFLNRKVLKARILSKPKINGDDTYTYKIKLINDEKDNK